MKYDRYVGKVVFVVAYDHATEHSSIRNLEDIPISVIETWGLFLGDTDKYIIILNSRVGSYEDDDFRNDYFQIIKSAIKKIEIIGE